MYYALSGSLSYLTPFQLIALLVILFMFLITFFVSMYLGRRKSRRNLAEALSMLQSFKDQPPYDIQDDILRDEFHS